MDIKLLKQHNEGKPGDIIDVTPDRASYLVRCQVAEYTDGFVSNIPAIKPKAKETSKAAPKQNKQVKPKLEKK